MRKLNEEISWKSENAIDRSVNRIRGSVLTASFEVMTDCAPHFNISMAQARAVPARMNANKRFNAAFSGYTTEMKNAMFMLIDDAKDFNDVSDRIAHLNHIFDTYKGIICSDAIKSMASSLERLIGDDPDIKYIITMAAVEYKASLNEIFSIEHDRLEMDWNLAIPADLIESPNSAPSKEIMDFELFRDAMDANDNDSIDQILDVLEKRFPSAAQVIEDDEPSMTSDEVVNAIRVILDQAPDLIE